MRFKKYRKVKYFNKSTVIDNIRFRSLGEADYYLKLKLRKRAGEFKDFEYEPYSIDIKFNGVLITRYKIDFRIDHHDGTIEYIEYKGYMDYASNLRWKCFTAFFANHENVKCTLVKHKSVWNWHNKKLNYQWNRP